MYLFIYLFIHLLFNFSFLWGGGGTSYLGKEPVEGKKQSWGWNADRQLIVVG